MLLATNLNLFLKCDDLDFFDLKIWQNFINIKKIDLIVISFQHLTSQN